MLPGATRCRHKRAEGVHVARTPLECAAEEIITPGSRPRAPEGAPRGDFPRRPSEALTGGGTSAKLACDMTRRSSRRTTLAPDSETIIAEPVVAETPEAAPAAAEPVAHER